MRPKTLSATSLLSAQECLAKYKAEYIDYIPKSGSTRAADVGTSVHGALEKFVQLTCIDKTEGWSQPLLLRLFHESYNDTFGHVDKADETYRDGVNLVKTWFKRTDLSEVEVLSVEKKTRWPFPASDGTTIPFTFIFDRLDIYENSVGQRVLRVVDYKTVRAYFGPDELREKIQARVYALFAAIQYKELAFDLIEVEFDLIRFDAVSTKFTREDNVSTWNMLQSIVTNILATSEVDPPETLGPGCNYCPIKATCKSLDENLVGGGIASIQNIDMAIERFQQVDAALAALKNFKGELEGILMEFAKENDAFAWDTDKYKVKTTSQRRRTIDAMDVYRVVGPDTFAAFAKINIGDVDRILNDPAVSEEDKEAIRSSIGHYRTSPNFKVERKA